MIINCIAQELHHISRVQTCVLRKNWVLSALRIAWLLADHWEGCSIAEATDCCESLLTARQKEVSSANFTVLSSARVQDLSLVPCGASVLMSILSELDLPNFTHFWCLIRKSETRLRMVWLKPYLVIVSKTVAVVVLLIFTFCLHCLSYEQQYLMAPFYHLAIFCTKPNYTKFSSSNVFSYITMGFSQGCSSELWYMHLRIFIL